jgi:heat shock protein HtpX
MKYVGIQTQIWRNNRNTVALLFLFPVILLAMVLMVLAGLDLCGMLCYIESAASRPCIEKVVETDVFHWAMIWDCFLMVLPYALGTTLVWFAIAYFANTAIIRHATGARPLERKENLRVYNIVENLCIAGNIYMPKINIVDDPNLNAFASGIDDKSYTVTLTTGIIEKLDDDELSAVVAHELTHIKNRDTRLLVVCIVFVGIFSTLMTISVKLLAGMGRAMATGRGRRNNKGGGGFLVIILVALLLLICSSVAFFFGTLTRLAISRKREYVADAGGAELCGDPLALSSALRKISAEPGLGQVRREDVAQLYIVHPDEEDDGGLTGLVAKVNLMFCTHPDTPERIKLLEQF